MRAALASAEITAWEPGLLTLGWGDFRGGLDGVDEPLMARALVVDDGTTTLAYVCADLCFISELLRDEVVARLDGVIPPHALMLTASHTHSGHSGISHYPLYSVSAPGVSAHVVRTVADGIATAVRDAMVRLRPAVLRYREHALPRDQRLAHRRSVRSHRRYARRHPAASVHRMRVLRVDDDSVASLMAVGMALLAPIGWPLLLAIVAGVGGFAVGALAGSLPGATGIPDPAIGRGARS